MAGRGDLGTSDVRKRLNGARVNFKPLDSDPDGIKDGDAWLRGDITSGDRIGTFRFYDGESIRSAGVFEPSNLEASEEGFLRIPLGSTVGVVPALSPQDAYIGALRARHGGQVYGLGREPAIPDSVVSQYQYEDDSDTSTAIDSVGNNDATITGASYSADAAVGSLALDHDDDETVSDSAVDLSDLGDTSGLAVAAYIKPTTVDDFQWVAGWENDTNNFVYIVAHDGSNPTVWRGFANINGSRLDAVGTTELSATRYDHVYVELTDSDFRLLVDGSEEGSDSHSLDPSNIGAGNYRTGRRSDGASPYTGLVDDVALCEDPLSQSDLDALVSRGN